MFHSLKDKDYIPKKKGHKTIRAMIKPIKYRTERCDTFFFNHSESAMPIPRKVAIMAVMTVKKIPSAIVLYFCELFYSLISLSAFSITLSLPKITLSVSSTTTSG